MRIKNRLIVGVVIFSLLVGAVGLLGMYANIQVVSTFESGEEHFTSIVMSSVEISSYAKRA